MSAPLADAEARRRIRDDLDTTFVVEAAAGTGKTSALVERVLSVLRSGRGTLRSVVAVTFTEKAAGEMKLRLRAEIERARNDTRASPIERDRLDASLEELETARIGTIHSFCADLLHERPLEAGVDPLFEVAAQDESDALFEATFDRWFERIVADPPPGIARILRRRPRSSQASGPREELLAAGLRSIEHRDFPTPWRTEPFDREGAAIELVARLRALAAYAGRADYPDDKLGENFAEIARFVRELDHREKVRGRDIDGLEAELRELARHWTWKMSGRRKRYGEGLSREVVVAERDETKALLATFLARAGAHLAGLLSSELAPLAAEYAQLMEREGKLDFLDLLLRARDLLRGRDDIRAELARRFTHVFVDEQQDTDPLQAEILLLLCADDPAERDWTRVRPKPGKLFLVGDPKQSIYRFRRADIVLYEATKARLLARGAELLHLSSSFRATPSLQSLVNASFEPVMRADASLAQPGYVPLGPVRTDPVGQPSIVALPVPRPYGGYGKVTNKAIDDSLPGAVAAFVEWMVRESGWTVTERDANERVPVGPRHICLLFKRFSAYGGDTTREYVRALEARRIPHVLVGGRSFHDREEVIAVRNLLTAVEWPDDELAVFATLRGPFLALSDEELLVFRHVHATLHPLAPIDPAKLDETTAPVASALELLRTLHVGRNRRPIAETLELFLSSVRAHAGVAIWPTGEQALANVLRLLDLARRFETRGTTSFRAFVEKIERDSELGEAAEAPVVEEGTEGVRIMTVHKAKGLELPVVILCDPTAARAHDRPSRWIEPERGLWVEGLAGCVPVELEEHATEIRLQDEAEAIRVAYVAATRARDLLVVPVV
ncbi:MAG: UvrD-helicase domain-containing protein, partial [Deltaproteobacteria bacterium]|nr:UvrD-helicase domain-containing protein [Deltaproteobacteria bacterium]